MLVEEIRKEKKRLYEQGFQQSKLEDARIMLLKGLSVPLIIEITGLSREAIEKLQQASPLQSSNN